MTPAKEMRGQGKSGQPRGVAPTLDNASERFHKKFGQPRRIAPTEAWRQRPGPQKALAQMYGFLLRIV